MGCPFLSLGQDMRRREFIKVIGGTAAVWPVVALAQGPALPVIAFVGGGTADSAGNYAAAFRKGLSESGYVEGKNVTIEYHWLEGQAGGLPSLMADLVRRSVTVVFTANNVGTLAAKAATSDIPHRVCVRSRSCSHGPCLIHEPAGWQR